MKVFYSSLQKKHVIKKEVYNGKAHPYNDKVSRVDSILKAFSDHIASAIVNAQKYKFLQEELTRLKNG